MTKSEIIAQGIELIMLNKHEIMEAARNREEYTFDIYTIADQDALGEVGTYPCTHEFDIYAGICDNALVGLNTIQRNTLFRGWAGHSGHINFPIEGSYDHYCRDAEHFMLWLNPKRWELLEHVLKEIKEIEL